MADVRLKKKIGKGRHASTIKRARQALKQADRNSHYMATMKTAIKKVREAVAAGKKDDAAKLFIQAESVIAKTAQKGVIPRQRGSRYVSRLAAAVNKLSA